MHDQEHRRSHEAPAGPFGYGVCDGCGVAVQRRALPDHECDPERYAAHQSSRLHWRRAGFDDALRRWLETPAGDFARYDAQRVLRRSGVPRPGEA